jgi:hypothetical protein
MEVSRAREKEKRRGRFRGRENSTPLHSPASDGIGLNDDTVSRSGEGGARECPVWSAALIGGGG